MKKPFGNKNNRPFAPSNRSFGGPSRDFGGRRDDNDRPSRGPREFDRDSRGPQDRPGKPAWKKDRPSFGAPRDGDRPAWKKDRPAFGGPSRDGDRPAWKKDRPAFGSPRDGERPAWKKDRPSFGGPSRDGDRPAWKKDKPSFGSRPDGDRPAWKKDRPDGDRPAWKKDRPDGDRPSWKSDRPAYGADRDNDRPAWKKDRPAFSAGAGKPSWKRDQAGSGDSGDRPAWKKDRPSFYQGPGGKPRGNFQSGGFRDRDDRDDNRGGAPRWEKPRGFGQGGGADRGYGKPSGGYGKPGGYSDRPQRDFKSDRPSWKPADKSAQFDRYDQRPSSPESEKSPRDFDETQQAPAGLDKSGRERVSVPSNKLNRPGDDYTAPRKPIPFDPGFVPNGPTAKALVVTLEDTNNVPTRIVWVYDTMVGQLPDGEPAPGATVFVYDDRNRFLGSAIYNSHSRIRARIFSLTRRRFDEEYIREALQKAVQRRKKLGLLTESCRVIFGDSDGIPGLIADKIGSYLVIQPLTFAVNQHLPFIIDRLNELIAPEGIVVRKDVPIRAKEGLTVEPPELHGNVPEMVAVKEAGVTLYANITGGQKTGLFLDQRINREVIKPYCTPEASVLDLFCHVGGWALRARRYGAGEVIGVDSSRSALDLAENGAKASGFSDGISFVEDDVFEYLRGIEQGKLFDVIVCDPPAFAKTRQHYEEAFRAYLSLNYLAMKRLKPGGLLVTCSCSQALSSAEFNEAVLTGARNARMQFQVLERRGAPADHPVMLGLPETEYLKCFVLERTE